MMKRIRERDLIVPALQIMVERGGSITTRDLILELRAWLQPTGDDLLILKGRTDDRFSQIVRNLRSHKTFELLGLARYGSKTGGEVSITVYGRKYLAKQVSLAAEASAVETPAPEAKAVPKSKEPKRVKEKK